MITPESQRVNSLGYYYFATLPEWNATCTLVEVLPRIL